MKKFVIGNTKVYNDPKLEKPLTYEIALPKDDKSGYFDSDKKGKGTVNSGHEDVITFTFKPQVTDPFIVKYFFNLIKF